MKAMMVVRRSEILGLPHYDYWFEVDGKKRAVYLGEIEMSIFQPPVRFIPARLEGLKVVEHARVEIGPFVFRVLDMSVFYAGRAVCILDGRFYFLRSLWYGRARIVRKVWGNLRIRLLMTAWVWGLADRNSDLTEPILKLPWRKRR